MTIKSLTISGAYGRDYKSKKDVIVAWNGNKDFVIRSPYRSGYINREDAIKHQLVTVHIRYMKDTRVVIVDIPT
jgi:hypothetical protein